MRAQADLDGSLWRSMCAGLTALAPSALASDYAIKDVQDGYEVSFISIVEAPAKTGIMSLAFDADADHMAFGDKSGLVHIFDAISDELQVTLEGHTDWGESMCTLAPAGWSQSETGLGHMALSHQRP